MRNYDVGQRLYKQELRFSGTFERATEATFSPPKGLTTT